MTQVLRPLKNLYKAVDYPDLLVGMDEPDDAAVWKLDDERSLVVTTDFFTPVVDDPYAYGAIAAANSLSDVYAMGAKPFMGLNIAALPPQLDAEFVSEIIRGGAEKALEAGIAIVGGHTVQDKEPKYGLVALGFVNNDQIMTKSSAAVGDQLLLTKPLGFGVTTTALKKGIADQKDVDLAIEWMAKLNAKAAELAVAKGVKAATDITGFSFLGHAWEMSSSSKVGLRIDFAKVPFLPCAQKYAEQGAFAGGVFNNASFYGPYVEFSAQITEQQQYLLFDPQTSGGLLLSLPGEKLDAFMKQAEEQELPVWHIGEVVEGDKIQIV